MAHFASVGIDKNLNLNILAVNNEAGAGDPQTIRCKVQLSRIAAQQLGHALLEFAGVSAKSYDRRDSTMVPAFDRCERTKVAPSRVIRLGSKSKR